MEVQMYRFEILRTFDNFSNWTKRDESLSLPKEGEMEK